MDVKEIRKDITEIIRSEKIDQLDGKYGIKLLLEIDFFDLIDCRKYVFGSEFYQKKSFMEREFMSSNNKILQPEPLSLIRYMPSSCSDEDKHVGIVSPNLTIISKWGALPVFEHPLMHVPNIYGEHVEYFRTDINRICRFCHPSLIRFLNLETSLPSVRQQRSKTLN